MRDPLERQTEAAPRTRTVGVAWGDPRSARTYSGVPQPLFCALERRGSIVAMASADLTRLSDLASGLVDWRRSFQARRPRKKAIWRYLPENLELLSQRFQRLERTLPDHDSVLQFGVAGVPVSGTALVSHVEIPVRAAITTEVFAQSYGFDRLSDRTVRQAVDGERSFLDRSALVWTNTAWTADLLEAEGVERSRLRVYPPACAGADPGEIERDWEGCHILFIGKDWTRKGGQLLLDAFRAVRRAKPKATLSVVGCTPSVTEPGVRVLGFLDRDIPNDERLLDDVLRRSTMFCMPSQWESTGLVYLEAALYGLPLVMLAGQGRHDVFPADMAVQLERGDPELLAEVLLDLCGAPDRLASMGKAGRTRVLENHTLSVVADRVQGWLEEVVARGA